MSRFSWGPADIWSASIDIITVLHGNRRSEMETNLSFNIENHFMEWFRNSSNIVYIQNHLWNH